MQITVETVSEYLEKIKEKLQPNNLAKKNIIIGDKGLPNNFFFRGQACDYGDTNNVAGVFREEKDKSGYTPEFRFANEYILRFREIFNNMENNFSRLSYMQHFGIPTRLLDVTSNPLVALYFACQASLQNNKHDRDGLVSIFHSNYDSGGKQVPLFSKNSDTVEVLSTLALMPEVKKNEIFDEIKDFQNLINEKKYDEFYEEWYMDIVHKFPTGFYNQLTTKEGEKYKGIKRMYNDLNRNYNVRALYHDIKKDIGHFEEKIDFKNLLQPIFVVPSINNERLRAQRGFFLFEPYNGVKQDSKEINQSIEDKFILEDTEKEKIKISIPEACKETILEELDVLCGINQATLFPDLENTAKYVKTIR